VVPCPSGFDGDEVFIKISQIFLNCDTCHTHRYQCIVSAVECNNNVRYAATMRPHADIVSFMIPLTVFLPLYLSLHSRAGVVGEARPDFCLYFSFNLRPINRLHWSMQQRRRMARLQFHYVWCRTHMCRVAHVSENINQASIDVWDIQLECLFHVRFLVI